MTAISNMRIGTAGWAIPPATAAAFPLEGSSLARYAAVLPCAEINSTFRKAHRPSTLERWAASVPDSFRFSVKLPKTITHVLRLAGAEAELRSFLASLDVFGDRLGPLLVQLPPSLQFDAPVAEPFFTQLSTLARTSLVCEPRHATWFEPPAEELLVRHGVARVGADRPPVPAASAAGGDRSLLYLRLHGSPRVYYSSYPDDFIERVALDLLASPAEVAWCIFDNTASGAALGDALRLRSALAAASHPRTSIANAS